ncbi:hypothetical protein CVIRNUC_005278 [Coccomyxa viridis]|uniref:Transmembrane protein n=1 Tax=Coccomyxa viridis TaxID=1274662 RepID=A0AAV1I6Y4_9CHLO|nr:hypothetical protein CVIRNUC_005278 [Coccomyxa viridis]
MIMHSYARMIMIMQLFHLDSGGETRKVVAIHNNVASSSKRVRSCSARPLHFENAVSEYICLRTRQSQLKKFLALSAEVCAMIGSMTQPCAGLAAPSGWQCCPCQPLLVRPRRARFDRSSIKVRAEEEEEKKVDVKSFFSGSTNASRGYTDEDSAGQSNIFAVEPKQYVAGSQRDDGTNSNTIALVAAGVGVLILFVGLLALKGEKPASSVAVAALRKEVTQYRSLRQLRDQLAVAPAPASASSGVEL